MTKRNFGLDIARICAMLGIIVLHFLGQGGELAACRLNSVEYWISWWLEICAYCSVDLFAILSGWLGINKTRNSIFRGIELIEIILLYSISITIICLLAIPELFSGYKDVLYSVFPVLEERYWYITCYIPLLIFRPFLNKMLLILPEKQHRNLCILAIILFTCIPSILMKDFFAFNSGNSFVWLAVSYMIGAYLRRVELNKWVMSYKYRYVGVFFTGSVILLFGNMFLYNMVGINLNYFISYTSPIILLMAISFLLFMNNAKISKGRKIVKQLSLCAFDIYIIHCHLLIYDNLIKNHFMWIAKLPAFVIPIAVVGCAFGVYLILSLIGIIRIILFEKAQLNKLGKYISSKLDKVIYLE